MRYGKFVPRGTAGPCSPRARRARAPLALLGLALAGEVGAIAVSGVSPAMNALTAPRDTPISIDFDRPLATATATAASVRVWARSGGLMPGTIAFANGDRRLVFTPAEPFFPGEQVYVQLANTIAGADATPMRAGGYAYSFLTRAGSAAMSFTNVQTATVRTDPDTATVLYGGAFPDLDGDGWIDYVAINEASDDVRVLMNRADGTGRVNPVLTPTAPIGHEGSPNEAVDFDYDGRIDLAVSNSSSNFVSILRGNGNGSFAPQQTVNVGQRPHGIAALDVDGDADLDLVNANENSGNLSMMRNDGAGVFGAATTFDSGGNGEYSLAAGDMNNDGLVDVVVGARNSQQLFVMLSNGAGTFTRVQNPNTTSGGFPAGGLTWMIAIGDVDGDGNLDVSTVNSNTNNGAILRGDGAGALAAPVTTAFAGSAIATDLGDLDGDGDLDWVVSSYSGSRWYVLRNDGAGAYSVVTQITAPDAGSCASIYDFDNDGDLDLALADEIEDVVLFEQNAGTLLFANGFE